MIRWCWLSLFSIALITTAARVDGETAQAKSPPGKQASAASAEFSSPLGAKEAIKHIHLPDGLRIELVAQEPQVIDPVAMRFDASGRLWVAEMRDYPHGPAEGEAPSSTIKILYDKDGDGIFETAKVFADKLFFDNGIQPWRTAVIATIGGRVAYLPDDDHDGKADRIEPWFQGFAELNSQLRANHPTLSIDNQIYVANGLRGGAVIDVRPGAKQAKPLSISGMDFRFDPLGSDYQAISGIGQFGLTFDEAGRRFVCSNRNPLKHIVLPNRYLRRNPTALAKQVAYDVAKSGADSKLFPISRAWTTSTLHANQFTAACGVTIYSGNRLPSVYHRNALTCDPTGNLVHREIMRPLGATFTSKPARDGVEFLASPDEWFRPVNMENGPDGSLYVVDMYRAVIEHPQFVPEELKNRPDQRNGDNLGRIYRVVPDTTSSPSPRLLAGAADKVLVDALGADNGWHRETAARLILERRSASLSSLLAAKLKQGPPLAQARSLWLLESMSGLTDAMILGALKNPNSTVKVQALRLSESRLLQDAGNEKLRKAVRELSRDKDAQVRCQAALSLTPASDADGPALTEIAWRGAADSWTRQATTIAAGKQVADIAEQILTRCLKAGAERDESTSLLAAELVQLAARQSPESESMLRQLESLVNSNDPAAIAILLGHIDGVIRARSSYPALRKKHPSFDRAVSKTIERSAAIARGEDQTDAKRVQSIRFLGAMAPNDASSMKTLAELAYDRGTPRVIRLASIGALSRSATDAITADLLSRFPSESPDMRRAILDLSLARGSRIALLLDQVQSGNIKLGEIDRVRTNRLLKISTPSLKPRIAKLFAGAIPEDRKKVLQDYQPVFKLKADPRRGELVFRKNCATCHRVGNWGVDVAPDIADSRTRQPAQLLTDILQPNRAIDSNYVSYSVITDDGRSLTGVLAVETSDSITLKLAEGKTEILARDEIDEMRSNGVSLMPEGLEKNIDQQQMADLISYIKNWRYMDGLTPYTKPK